MCSHSLKIVCPQFQPILKFMLMFQLPCCSLHQNKQVPKPYINIYWKVKSTYLGSSPDGEVFPVDPFSSDSTRLKWSVSVMLTEYSQRSLAVHKEEWGDKLFSREMAWCLLHCTPSLWPRFDARDGSFSSSSPESPKYSLYHVTFIRKWLPNMGKLSRASTFRLLGKLLRFKFILPFFT